jgi:hypothetical protein
MSPLRVGALLKARGLTAYQLSRLSDGELTMSKAYRLANGETERLDGPTVALLCRLLGVTAGELFAKK